MVNLCCFKPLCSQSLVTAAIVSEHESWPAMYSSRISDRLLHLWVPFNPSFLKIRTTIRIKSDKQVEVPGTQVLNEYEISSFPSSSRLWRPRERKQGPTAILRGAPSTHLLLMYKRLPWELPKHTLSGALLLICLWGTH